MDALWWAVAFVLMVFIMGGSALGCVFMVERGKNARNLEREKSARLGMENAWSLEQAKLEIIKAGGKALPSGAVQEFTLPETSVQE